MNYQRVAAVLKKARSQTGETQEEYAGRLKIPRARLVNWEQARVEPTFSLTELVDFRRHNPELFEHLLSEAERELDAERESEPSAIPVSDVKRQARRRFPK